MSWVSRRFHPSHRPHLPSRLPEGKKGVSGLHRGFPLGQVWPQPPIFCTQFLDLYVAIYHRQAVALYLSPATLTLVSDQKTGMDAPTCGTFKVLVLQRGENEAYGRGGTLGRGPGVHRGNHGYMEASVYPGSTTSYEAVSLGFHPFLPVGVSRGPGVRRGNRRYMEASAYPCTTTAPIFP